MRSKSTAAPQAHEDLPGQIALMTRALRVLQRHHAPPQTLKAYNARIEALECELNQSRTITDTQEI